MNKESKIKLKAKYLTTIVRQKIIEFFSDFKLKFIKAFSINIPLMLFLILGLSIMLSIFKNKNQDTTNLTNYGFAILIGFSSVCFSWARNMNPEKEPKMLEKISNCGEVSLLAAILFLVASLIKYCHINIDEIYFMKKIPFIYYRIINIFLELVYGICFVSAYYHTYYIFKTINNVIFNRQYKETKY